VPFSKTDTKIVENNNTGLSELHFDSKYKLKGEYEFDEYGNMTCFSKIADSIAQNNIIKDVPISYSYNYHFTKPVIEAKGVHVNTLNNVVSLLNLDQTLLQVGALLLPGQRSQWKTFNETLRSNQSLKGALITTYTYIPMIGMTSSTDPSGITTYYEYDKLGRLIYIRDKNYNIVKKYDYHYQGQ